MVAIKMDMPENCAGCVFAQGEYANKFFWCYAASQYAELKEKNKRQDFCPMIEVAAISPVISQKLSEILY